MDSFTKRNRFVHEVFEQANGRKRIFSLKYDGESVDSSSLKTTETRQTKDKWEEREVVYEIVPGKLELRLNMRIYNDFPVVECLPYLENPGNTSSGIVEDFRSLDLLEELPPQYSFCCGTDGSRIRIRYNLGAYSDINDFIPQERELWTRLCANQFIMECPEGRPSSAFLPYFGIDTGKFDGMNIGIGWGGAWRAETEILLEDTSVFFHAKHFRISLSMLKTRFQTLPGEKLRQPGFFLHFRSGKTVREAQNEHRRFMIAHHAPHDSKGNLMETPLSLVTWGGLSSTKMLERIEAVKKHKLPYEVFWIDAGWSGFPGPCPHFLDEDEKRKYDYPDDWSLRVGNWNINSFPHPDGLRPVSDAARKAGMKFLAWFEPERIHKKCRGKLLSEHPEWLKSSGDSDSLMLDLGNPDALDYIFNTIRKLIEEQGIDVYREDFNFNTLPYWAAMDAPDRIGVAEMKHVAGHYELWERLHRAFPDMPFDNCATGGRRLDYLALTYSWPLCQSDYACFPGIQPEYIQTENLFLHDWIPLHTSFTWMPEHDEYELFSCFGTMISNKVWSYDSRSIPADNACDWEWHRNMLRNLKRMRSILIEGDIYPLTERPDDLSVWCACQVHIPEKDSGYILVFRRPQSPASRMVFFLAGIQPEAEYELEYPAGVRKTVMGELLSSGFEVTMDTPRSVTLVYYKRNDC